MKRASREEEELKLVFIQTIQLHMLLHSCFTAHCSLVSTTESQNKGPGFQPGQLVSFCVEVTCSSSVPHGIPPTIQRHAGQVSCKC